MKRLLFFVLGVFASLGLVGSLHAQGTAFTYQGKLSNANGAPASGVYDFQFYLHPTSTATNVTAGPYSTLAVQVTNGLFNVQVDFGSGIFVNAPLWLEIDVRTNGVGAFTALSPTQPITPTPYAITAENVSGTIVDSQLSSNIVR